MTEMQVDNNNNIQKNQNIIEISNPKYNDYIQVK